MKTKTTRWFLAAALAAVILSLAACAPGAGGAAAQGTPTAVPPVIAPEGVVSDGRIVPVQTASLSFTNSGVVAEVLVKEGETVKAGQVIARLNGAEQRQAAVASAQMELLSAQQEIDALKEGVDLARAQAQLKVAEADKELDKATKRRISRDYHVGSPEATDLAWADYIRAQKAVEDAERVFEYFKNRDPFDVNRAEVLAQMARARQTRDTALANFNYLRSKPNQLEVNEAEAQLQVARAALASAQLELEKVKAGPNPDQLALAQARISNAEAQLTAAKADLAGLDMTAPFAGTLVSNPLKVGELVTPGQSSLVLADLSKWRVETTELTELNVVGLKPQDKVTVSVDALPDVKLNGHVTSVQLQGENRQGDIVYTVKVDLDQQHPDLRWNMTASVAFGE